MLIYRILGKFKVKFIRIDGILFAEEKSDYFEIKQIENRMK